MAHWKEAWNKLSAKPFITVILSWWVRLGNNCNNYMVHLLLESWTRLETESIEPSKQLLLWAWIKLFTIEFFKIRVINYWIGWSWGYISRYVLEYMFLMVRILGSITIGTFAIPMGTVSATRLRVPFSKTINILLGGKTYLEKSYSILALQNLALMGLV